MMASAQTWLGHISLLLLLLLEDVWAQTFPCVIGANVTVCRNGQHPLVQLRQQRMSSFLNGTAVRRLDSYPKKNKYIYIFKKKNKKIRMEEKEESKRCCRHTEWKEADAPLVARSILMLSFYTVEQQIYTFILFFFFLGCGYGLGGIGIKVLCISRWRPPGPDEWICHHPYHSYQPRQHRSIEGGRSIQSINFHVTRHFLLAQHLKTTLENDTIYGRDGRPARFINVAVCDVIYQVDRLLVVV